MEKQQNQQPPTDTNFSDQKDQQQPSSLPLFPNLSLDGSALDEEDTDHNQVTTIESLCMNCSKMGTTRLFLAKIPFYKEVVLSSFKCDECGFDNNEIQSAAEIQEMGVRIKLRAQHEKDLNRKVVKSDFSKLTIPEVELEIPSKTQKGEITTVEGVIDRVVRGLEQDQNERSQAEPESAARIDRFLKRLECLKRLETPFTMIIEDISGNSFVESFSVVPEADPQLEVTKFSRLIDEDRLLGIYSDHDTRGGDRSGCYNQGDSSRTGLEGLSDGEQQQQQPADLKDEVLGFRTNCPSCSRPCDTNMKVVKIPHFKEVIIMATSCQACSYRTNEVKSGSGIEAKGTRIKFRITKETDLSRDVLKSETCHVEIPELQLEVGGAALGGRFTTLEGLLLSMQEQLRDSNPMMIGDSADPDMKKKLDQFSDKFDLILKGQLIAHVILDDPAGNSYLQNPFAPDNDPEMEVEHYERSFEQNEELGLNDINTE